MQPDGSYIQRKPADADIPEGSHCQLIAQAEKRIELYRKRTKKNMAAKTVQEDI